MGVSSEPDTGTTTDRATGEAIGEVIGGILKAAVAHLTVTGAVVTLGIPPVWPPVRCRLPTKPTKPTRAAQSARHFGPGVTQLR